MPIPNQIDPQIQQLIDQLIGQDPGRENVPLGPGPELTMRSVKPFDPGFRPLDTLGGFVMDLLGINPEMRPEPIQPAGVDPSQGALGPAALLLLAKKLAGERGLEAQPVGGSGLQFRGPSGQQLNIGRTGQFADEGLEILDLLSVGKGEAQSGRNLLELFDDLATQGDFQGRRGLTSLSESGQKSIIKGQNAGRLVRDPGSKGFFSTAQSTGKKIANRASGAAKGAVSGVSVLLEPLFGLIQNDPEGLQLLNSLFPNLFKPKA